MPEEIRGYEEYSTEDGFKVARIHYTAEPSKDPSTLEGQKWLERELSGYVGGMASSSWQAEMEIDWDATGGDLCFPQMNPYLSKIYVNPFEVPESWAFYAGFDYGHRNPCALNVNAIDHDNNIWTVWEYYKSGEGYRKVAQAIRACPYWDRLRIPPIADPSIWAKNQAQKDSNENKSVADLFRELPKDEQVIFMPGKAGGDIAMAEKINGLLWNEEMLKKGEEPRWKIFKTCPKLKWELAKLRYADWSSSQAEVRNNREQIVDKDNHATDAFKYFLHMFFDGPPRPQEETKLEKLRERNPDSYRFWKSEHKKRRELRVGRETTNLGDWD